MKLFGLLSEHLEYILETKIRNIPTVITIDLNPAKSYLFSVNDYGMFSITYTHRDTGQRITVNDVKKINNLVPYTPYSSVTNSGFFLPEYQTLMMFSSKFHERLGKFILQGKRDEKLEKQWDLFIYENMRRTLGLKRRALLNMAEKGTQDGLGKLELDRYRKAQVPLYVSPDFGKIQAYTKTDNLIISGYADSHRRILRKLNKTFKSGDLEEEKAVYYAGGRVYGNRSADCSTIYVPKIRLIEEGYEGALDCLEKIIKEV